MPFNPRRPDAPPTHGVYVMPPRQGRSSLLGIESAFASLRSPSAQFSFEIYGQDRLISYFVRAQQYPALSGILAACYPQAQLADPQEYRPRNDRSSTDWIDTNAQESLYVLPLYLRHEPYLPLRFYTDQSLARGETDPLASVLGYLSAASAGGLRIGARLLIQPASTKWAHPWQRQLQQRRDRQDLTTPMPTQTRATQSTNRYGETQSADLIPGIPTPLILGLGAVGALGYLGYQLYETGHTAELIAAAATLPFLAAGGYVGYRKLFKKDTVRAYFDEEMAAAKLGAQGFNVELQLLCVLPKRLGKNPAVDALEGLAAVYSQFDNQAGNAWEPGKLRLVEPLKRNPSAGNIHNTLDMGPPAQDRRRMKKTILSPRELGTIWHLPMGEEESALMRRAGSRQLRTYLHGVDEGAMVGYAIGSDDPIHISDQMLRRHMLLLGKSGMGKSALATHIIAGKLRDKAKGKNDDAIVVIDPHRDLVKDILSLIPEELSHKVRLIDIGNRQRIPAINLLDPQLHRNRDRCVSVIIESLRHLWENWGPRMHDIMDCCLKAIYEFNDHKNTTREEMLTMLDILPLLAFETPPGRRPTGPATLSDFQRKILDRVTDPHLLMRFDRYSRWSEQLRNDAFAPVETRISGFASDEDPRAIMGQWETTIDFAQVIRDGQILLVNTARGTVGRYVSSLMGSTIVSLVEAALREQEQLDREDRHSCLIVADEFQTFTGTAWEELLAEIRKYGGMVLLITQGLARLDTNERKLKAGVLANCGGLICYQISGEDADHVVDEMGSDHGLSGTDLVGLNPYNAYLKLTINDVTLPPFSIRTRPPETGSGEALHAIATGMLDYTRDRDEALRQIGLRMRANGDARALRVEPPPKTAAEISSDAIQTSAISPDVVAQVLAQMADAAAATDVPPQVSEAPAGPAQEPPAPPPIPGTTPRDPNTAFRRGRPRKRADE